jgi:hypothetical protein
MQNKRFRSVPIALTTTYTTNLLNPAAASGGVNGGSSGQYILVQKIRVTNKTGSAATFRMYIGATGANAAGTELYYDQSVPANSTFEEHFQGGHRIDTADFVVGGASANTTLVAYFIGEIGVAG